MSNQINTVRWVLARSGFVAYLGFSAFTLVGGVLTAPLMSWCFFRDWRFWRYLGPMSRFVPHGWRLLRLMARDRRAFMFGVSMTTPPRSTPDPAGTRLHPNWPHGESCGSCSNCCRPGGHACPLLDQRTGLCIGHDSFYWRYFNCGRFPSNPGEIHYYGCDKWDLSPAGAIVLPWPNRVGEAEAAAGLRRGRGVAKRAGGR